MIEALHDQLSILKDVDLLKSNQVEQSLVINMLCVDPQEAGKGLGLQMLSWSEAQARKHGLSLITAETTGIASSCVFQKAQFEKVKELLYDDYVVDGKRPFADMKPHKSCIIWKKNLLP